MYRTEKALETLNRLVKESPDTVIAPEMKRQINEKVEETKETLPNALVTDKWIYRIVVAFLGASILASLVFTYLISVGSANPQGPKIPDIFLAIGSAAVGALAGLLAPSPARGGNE